jgi:hypothetical protein
MKSRRFLVEAGDRRKILGRKLMEDSDFLQDSHLISEMLIYFIETQRSPKISSEQCRYISSIY